MSNFDAEAAFITSGRFAETGHQSSKIIRGDFSGQYLPEALSFLNRKYREIDVVVDPNTQALWCYMKPSGPPSYTPTMLRELNSLHQSIKALFSSLAPGSPAPFKYYVHGSRIPGIYNLGGDLGHMIRCITANDREALRRYAYDCVQAVYNAAVGFESPLVSIGLLQGSALGGGMEGAICCNVVVAERSVRMGLPEIMFNAFPGMGAYTFLSRRIGAAKTERLILSGQVYSAEEMYDMGVIDMIVNDGEGEAAVRDYIQGGRQSHDVRLALYKVRQRVNPVTLEELRDVTDIWVETALKLDASDLRRMQHLQLAQLRRNMRSQAKTA